MRRDNEIDDFEQLLSGLRLATDSPTQLLSQHLAWTKKQAQPFDGNWQAPWLLCDWTAPKWQTSSGNKTRKRNGEWIGTVNINWNQPLPDGSRLTDTRYSILLETCRRVSFLYRQGYIDGKAPAVLSWQSFTAFLVNLSHWLVLERSRYHPDKYGFSLIDQAGLKRLLQSLALGSWSEALAVVERSLNGLYQAVFRQPCPQALLNMPAQWPKTTREAVIDWLEANQGYSIYAQSSREDSGTLSRSLLGELASAPYLHLCNNQRLNAILRQFEPRLSHPSLLLSSSQRTEFPNQSVPLLKEALHSTVSKSAVETAGAELHKLLMLYRYQPEHLPSPANINLSSILASATKLAASENHTPFIPVDTGLQYLNHALRWVAKYGDGLVDYYLSVMSQLRTVADCTSANQAWRPAVAKHAHKILSQTPLPLPLQEAGFKFTRLSRPKRKGRNFENLRNQPTLHEALEIYIGAVTVVIALMKPSRDSEIVNLPRHCLLRTRGGHYWLDFELAKRTKAERRARSGGKPIPVITARAIQQVQKLNRGLTRIFNENDNYRMSKLFYLPNSSKWGTSKELKPQSLNCYLNNFCDYVGLPPDRHGRRWYLRIHQMRKWFLLLLFWSGRYDVLDAARWIAGHTDIEHLYAYIEREFPGGKIGQLEAECAIDRLAEYDITKTTIDGEDIGLVELYQHVLRQFNVKSLNMVPEREWHHLIEDLFERDYYLEPYSISTESGHKCLCVAIREGHRGDT